MSETLPRPTICSASARAKDLFFRDFRMAEVFVQFDEPVTSLRHWSM
jgi:hypothetical protein